MHLHAGIDLMSERDRRRRTEQRMPIGVRGSYGGTPDEERADIAGNLRVRGITVIIVDPIEREYVPLLTPRYCRITACRPCPACREVNGTNGWIPQYAYALTESGVVDRGNVLWLLVKSVGQDYYGHVYAI